ncbi:MAG: ester cyclase [Chloroflexota bacterium]
MNDRKEEVTKKNSKTIAKTPPITDVPYTGIEVLMDPGSEKRQPMQGFDDDYVDIVDYIVRCTHKIWEEHGIGLIYTHYGHNVLIHTADGMTYGRDKVIADTIKTQAAFPDVRLFADDVIWSGNDQDGFHSSHRIVWVAHNTGYSLYGPPTGKRVVRQGIAHCFVKENRVVEEWIARDELALIRQLGFDEIELAKEMAAQAAASGVKGPLPVTEGEVQRLRGQMAPDLYPAQDNAKFDIEDFVRRSFYEIWNWRLLNKIDDYYVSNYWAYASTNRQLYGLGDLKGYILALMAAFPDLAINIDHMCWLGDEESGYRVATRWTLVGTHSGPGAYGSATGKRIRLMGITHSDVKDGKFVKERIVFDEFALLKQIYWPAGTEEL